jgi:uncharacterized coiled-coil protein SlyX
MADDRNTLAVKESIAALQKQGHDQQVEINSLRTALSSMTERMTALERMLVTHKAASIGSGPSVK